ncbi:MAG: hypothetical protein GY754_28740 [bacterium]|nr:hypothetical protein [bacterium]
MLPVFHVIHTLKFQALSRSKIQFQYRANTIYAAALDTYTTSSEYNHWFYIFETGRTWKGPIKKCTLIFPKQLVPELPKQFAVIKRKRRTTIYQAKNYKPSKNDMIKLEYIRHFRFNSKKRHVTHIENETNDSKYYYNKKRGLFLRKY